MLEDVLSKISLCKKADAVFLVTAEEEAMRIGSGLGIGIIPEEKQKNESSSVDFGMRKCRAMGVESVLVVPGDIPSAQVWEFDAVMEKDDGRERVVIVPSRDGTGTNALMMRPSGVMPTSFGEDSFSRHRDIVSGLGIEFSSVTLGGIGLDIDGPEDLEVFMGGGGNTITHEYLRGIGMDMKTGETD